MTTALQEWRDAWADYSAKQELVNAQRKKLYSTLSQGDYDELKKIEPANHEAYVKCVGKATQDVIDQLKQELIDANTGVEGTLFTPTREWYDLWECIHAKPLLLREAN